MQNKTFLFIIIISAVSLAMLSVFLWRQKKYAWITYVQQTMEQQKQGQFEAVDKFGKSVILEWEMFAAQSPEFTKKMKDISGMVVQAYTPVEIHYLRQNPESVSHDFMFKECIPFFEKGLEKVNWDSVEEKVKAKLRQLVEVDFTQIFGVNALNLFVIATDKKTQNQLGVVQFLINPECAYGDISVPILGIIPEAQHRGLGKLLLSSIFILIPAVKRIFLSTRTTNKQAINAYKSWGFTPDQSLSAPEKGWIGFEYRTDQSDILQRVAPQFKNVLKTKEEDLSNLKQNK